MSVIDCSNDVRHSRQISKCLYLPNPFLVKYSPWIAGYAWLTMVPGCQWVLKGLCPFSTAVKSALREWFLSRKCISNHDYSGCSKVQAHERFRSRCRLKRNLNLLKAAANCRKACWYSMTGTKTAMAFYCHKYRRSKKKPNAAKIIIWRRSIFAWCSVKWVNTSSPWWWDYLYDWCLRQSPGFWKMIILFNATHPKIWNIDISFLKNYQQKFWRY